MKFRDCFFILIVLLVGHSCKTTEGDPFTFTIGAGAIVVNSTIHDARIFLDYRDTGLVTPAIISDVREGRHVVHVFLAGYRGLPDSLEVNVIEGEESVIEFDLNETPSVGVMEINSTPPGALVKLNKLPFGRTPVAIEGLQSGSYRVELLKGSYHTVRQAVDLPANQRVQLSVPLELNNHLILVEHFSNTDCPPCPEADEILERISQELGPDSLSAIAYHPDFPGPQDPFFLANPETNLARYDFYQRRPLPHVLVDGVREMVGTLNLESRLRSAIESRRNRRPPVALDFWNFHEVKQDPNVISGRVKAEVLQELPPGNYLVRIALIERHITFPAAPGSNGQTEFYDIMRVMHSSDLAPGRYGAPLTTGAGTDMFVDFRFERQPGWGDELAVVAFVQNDDTREVLHSIWSPTFLKN